MLYTRRPKVYYPRKDKIGSPTSEKQGQRCLLRECWREKDRWRNPLKSTPKPRQSLPVQKIETLAPQSVQTEGKILLKKDLDW